MKPITKVSRRCFLLYCGFIIAITGITHSAHAQVVTPYIVVTPSTIQPDCHTYTGCGVIIINRYYIHHYYRRHYYRRHCAYSVDYPVACYSETY